ncbi:flagellar hook-length control protein FliK [Pseudoalteromonas sp.]|uniref:flagellar hook-length control protein FliK n=1 Tax=Pseudoalteromonas sp. TaxID=53249 RepID=UPI0035656E40
MATINSQLSVTNLDLGLTSSTSEADNKNSFLAVLASVQSEAETNQREIEQEKANSIELDDTSESDNVALVHQQSGVDASILDDVSDKKNENQSDIQDNDVAQKVLFTEQQVAETSEESFVPDIAQSQDFQHFVSISDEQKVAQTAKTEVTNIVKVDSLNFKELNDKVSTHNNEPGRAISPYSTKPVVEEAPSFLEQLTKLQSLNVELMKATNDKNGAIKTFGSTPSETDANAENDSGFKFSQNIIKLEKELEKLDRDGLTALKQILSQIKGDGDGVEKLGLTKLDLHQINEKINLALEDIETQTAKQTSSFKSLLMPSSQESSERLILKTNGGDTLKISENTSSALSQLIDDGNIVIPANKVATISRPDMQMLHQVSQVESVVSQTITDETNQAQEELQKTTDTLNQQLSSTSQSAAMNQEVMQKQHMRNDLNKVVKHTIVEGENIQPDYEFNLANEEHEQPLSFSKLLNSLKNNANTPVLSQLVAQIQSSQFQQAELRDVNQQHIALQTAQVMQNTKQTHASAEQALQQPVNIAQSDAAKALFNKANMLLNLNLKEAEIRLDPPELGSMQIRIRSDAEQAQINFVVQSQQAKEMLEHSMGRLREMLAEQGINLGESNVSEQGQSEQQTAEHSGSSQANEGNVESNGDVSEQIVSKQKNGIDFYA